MMFLSKNWYFSVQKTLIYYTFNKSHHNSFILLVFSHVANFRYMANFRFLTLYIFGVSSLGFCFWVFVYCNSLFRGLSVANLRKLQCIQNSLARIVCRTTCLSHTTPLRKAFHWLPVRHCCIFKTAFLVYKYLHTNCPKYFSPFLKVRQCAYNRLD